MDQKIIYIGLVIFSFLLLSCSHQDKKLESILEISDNNRNEIEKVLTHYQNDHEKMNSVLFLIKNMIGKQSIDSNSIKNIQPYYDALTSHIEKYGSYKNDVQYLICDSIKQLYPNMAIYQHDIQKLSSNFLIHHIDKSIQIWHQYPWSKDIDAQTFNKYILPYTTNNYYWEQSLDFFDKKYAILRDTIKNKSYAEVGQLILHHIDTTFLKEWPIYEEYNELLPTTFHNIVSSQMGSCLEQNIYKITALRANAIPAVLNAHTGWANFSYSHFWTEIIDNRPTKRLYDNTQRPYISDDDILVSDMFWYNAHNPLIKDISPLITIDYCRTVSKVFRFNYEIQKNSLVLSTREDIPSLFRDPGIEDITDKYIVTKDIKVPLWNSGSSKKHIYLCCYNGGNWNPVSWSIPHRKHASFYKMGVNVLYLPAYYDNGRIIPAGNAFILTTEGELKYLSPQTNKTERTATFYTKIPYRLHTALKAASTVGTRFYLCNNRDLSDSIFVHEINKPPFYIDTFKIDDNKKYRYIICDFQNVHPIGEPYCIAEIKVLGKDQKKLTGNWTGTKSRYKVELENITDGSRLSYYQPDANERQQRIILDIGKAQEIEKIEFYPRSDDNKIVTGELYELFYWDGKWLSLGQQLAKDDKLVYHDVPKNVIFRIHNHTQGNEHRPFTYENGKQVWW